MPLRHTAPSPSQLPDSLHRLAKEQSNRPPDFLSGHAKPYEDGKSEHRGGYTLEVDPVRGICGVHGGHETVEVRDIRKVGGGRRLCGEPGKIVDGVSPRRPQSFRYQQRPVDDCSSGRGGMTQDGGTRGGTFHGIRAGLRHAVACPNETGRTNEKITPKSKCVRVGSLAVLDLSSHKWRELVSYSDFLVVCSCRVVFLSGVLIVFKEKSERA